MDGKSVGIFIIVLVVLFGALYYFSTITTTPDVDVSDLELSDFEVEDDDLVRGNAEADIVLVKYSDFQCPSCRQAYPFAKSIVDEYQDDMAYVYRHFPLDRFTHSRLMASAGEAAARQDSFWEMHDMIFDSQSQWSGMSSTGAEELVVSFAEELELDIDQFQEDLESEEIAQKVERDRQSGIEAGVNGTPTFFLNGEQVQLQGLEEILPRLIEEENTEDESDDLSDEEETDGDEEVSDDEGVEGMNDGTTNNETEEE